MTNAEIANAFIAEGWEDVTGGNDACDYILRKDDMQLVICAEFPCYREDEESARFQMTLLDENGEADYDNAEEFEDFRFVLNWISIELYEKYDVQANARNLPWTAAEEMLRDMSTDDPNYEYVRGWQDRYESLENIYTATWAYRNQLIDDERRREIDARLCAEWEHECEARGLRHGSAGDVLSELEPTDPNYEFVKGFIVRWMESLNF